MYCRAMECWGRRERGGRTDAPGNSGWGKQQNKEKERTWKQRSKAMLSGNIFSDQMERTKSGNCPGPALPTHSLHLTRSQLASALALGTPLLCGMLYDTHLITAEKWCHWDKTRSSYILYLEGKLSKKTIREKQSMCLGCNKIKTA